MKCPGIISWRFDYLHVFLSLVYLAQLSALVRLLEKVGQMVFRLLRPSCPSEVEELS